MRPDRALLALNRPSRCQDEWPIGYFFGSAGEIRVTLKMARTLISRPEPLMG